jgi:hypothetical protein
MASRKPAELAAEDAQHVQPAALGDLVHQRAVKSSTHGWRKK